MTELTQDELKRLFILDAESGVFYWVSGKRKGCLAGYMHHSGYVFIAINRKRYAAHRLAWLYTYGSLPANDLDHINGVKTDNRIENLRDVPRAVNSQNRRSAHKTNSTGYLGVSAKGNGFRARIKLNGATTLIGTFKTPIEAHEAYLQVKRVMHVGNTL